MADVTGIIDRLIALLPEDLRDRARGARKAIVAGLGALLTAFTLLSKFNFLIPAKYEKQVAMAVSIIAAALTYLTPNDAAVPVDG